MTNKLQLKRVYDEPTEQDGRRFLVERLWPGGVSKSPPADAEWLKEVAPSSELREWFHHDSQRWNEFRRRYFAKLKRHTDDLSPILEAPTMRKGCSSRRSATTTRSCSSSTRSFIGRSRKKCRRRTTPYPF